MKRIMYNPNSFRTFDMFDKFLRENGISIDEQTSVDTLMQKLNEQLNVEKRNQIMIHGKRTESMFSYIIASLGNCKLIKTEDCGETFAKEDNLKVPDYRVITSDDEEILIEVKNCYKDLKNTTIVFEKNYLEALNKYAEIFSCSLKLAIYWAKQGLWTLISPEDLNNKNEKFSIRFEEAMKKNEMCLLGDMLIGTEPQLKMRISGRENENQFEKDTDRLDFVIKNVELFNSDRKIENEKERKIALYFMFFCRWETDGFYLKSRDKGNVCLDIDFVPEDLNKEQGFQMVGYLSEMITREYNYLTLSKNDNKVEKISPGVEPGSLGVLIDKEYEGNALKLWRFIVKPNKEK